MSDYDLELVELYAKQFIAEGYTVQEALDRAINHVTNSVHG